MTVCKYCHEEIVNPFRGQLYHSQCRVALHRSRSRDIMRRSRGTPQIFVQYCQECGVLIPAARSTRKYCTPKCRTRAYRRRIKEQTK